LMPRTWESAQNRSQPAQKRALPRCIGRTKGGLNSKLYAVCDGEGKPAAMLLTEGQASDYEGAALLLDNYQTPRRCSVIVAMTAIGFGPP
jgi:hypothetical protein